MILGFLILSLLFSVGEGLRLSPFITVTTPESLSVPTHREESAFAPGSFAQNLTRTRTKSHHPDFEIPQLDKVVDILHFQSLTTDEHHKVAQLVSTRSSSTRAPPLK